MIVQLHVKGVNQNITKCRITKGSIIFFCSPSRFLARFVVHRIERWAQRWEVNLLCRWEVKPGKKYCGLLRQNWFRHLVQVCTLNESRTNSILIFQDSNPFDFSPISFFFLDNARGNYLAVFVWCVESKLKPLLNRCLKPSVRYWPLINCVVYLRFPCTWPSSCAALCCLAFSFAPASCTSESKEHFDFPGWPLCW